MTQQKNTKSPKNKKKPNILGAEHGDQQALAFSERQFSVGDLEIDNAFDTISLSGRLQIDKTEEGLIRANALSNFLNDVVDALNDLKSKGELELTVKKEPPVTRPNPFLTRE